MMMRTRSLFESAKGRVVDEMKREKKWQKQYYEHH